MGPRGDSFFALLVVSTGSCHLKAFMVRPTVVVGYSRIDLALVLCLIGSGSGSGSWFCSLSGFLESYHFPPRMYPLSASLIRSLAYYRRTTPHRSLVPLSLSITLPIRLHHFVIHRQLSGSLALWLSCSITKSSFDVDAPLSRYLLA